MSLGPLLIELDGTEPTPEERRWLRHPQVGGVVLRRRNQSSWPQLAGLVADLHAVRDTRLLVAVQQEGGRGQRLIDGFTRLPAAAELGGCYRRDHGRGLRLTEITGWLLAAELRAAGVDVAFAPLVDLHRHAGGVIGDRAFDRDHRIVATLAGAFATGMQEAGMAPVAGHFPGHGAVDTPSADGTGEDDRILPTLEASDLQPFIRLIGEGLPAVRMANLTYPRAAPLPAAISSFWVREVLRRQLGFGGVVIATAPANAAGRLDDWVMHALDAGCDLLQVPASPEWMPRLLDGLDGRRDPASQLRRARLHGRHAPDRDRLRRSLRWREAVRMLQTLEVDPLLDLDL